MLDLPHRRLNALTGEWVLVSPHRARRPWLGQVEKNPRKTFRNMTQPATSARATNGRAA